MGGLQDWGSETSSPDMGSPWGSCTCRTTMPSVFERSTQDREEEGMWFAQMQLKGFPKAPAMLLPATRSWFATLQQIYCWIPPFLAHCLESSKHMPFIDKRGRGSHEHMAGERGLCYGAIA